MTESQLVLIKDLTPEQIATICDHTFLYRPESYLEIGKKTGTSPVRLREQAFQSFLEETIGNKQRLPYAICVRPEDVKKTFDYLNENARDILIASVVGFPNGSHYSTLFKVVETELAIEYGATEIDMVLDYNKLKVGDINYVRKDIKQVVNSAHERGALIKLVFETSELNEEQIKKACEIASETNVDFIKTSTGFSAYGARTKDLKLMRANFEKGIKISGGVSPQNVRDLLYSASGRKDKYIELNPNKIRIGESSLLNKL